MLVLPERWELRHLVGGQLQVIYFTRTITLIMNHNANILYSSLSICVPLIITASQVSEHKMKQLAAFSTALQKLSYCFNLQNNACHWYFECLSTPMLHYVELLQYSGSHGQIQSSRARFMPDFVSYHAVEPPGGSIVYLKNRNGFNLPEDCIWLKEFNPAFNASNVGGVLVTGTSGYLTHLASSLMFQ